MDPRFRLQPVLNYRQDIEDALQLELGRLLQEEQEARARLEELRAESERSMVELSAIQSAPRIDVPAIQQGYYYLEALQGVIEHQVVVVNEATERVEAKRRELVKAMQDRKVLEKLKEKYQREYADWVRRVEQTLADDVVTTRYNRRLAGVEEAAG